MGRPSQRRPPRRGPLTMSEQIAHERAWQRALERLDVDTCAAVADCHASLFNEYNVTELQLPRLPRLTVAAARELVLRASREPIVYGPRRERLAFVARLVAAVDTLIADRAR